MSKYSLEETKELLDLFFAMSRALGKSLEDGNVNFMDLGHFISAISYIAPAVNGISNISKEMLDLDEKEKADLIAYVRDNFDLPNDKVEGYIEMGIIALINFVPIIKVFAEQGKKVSV